MDAAQIPPPVEGPHRWITRLLRGIVVIGLGLEVYEGHWLNATLVGGILLLTFLPTLVAQHVRIRIPPEFELATIAFIFAALFLGETRDYYGRFWWWDLALHATSGMLLGVLGFLLVYILNENPRIDLRMRPEFLAFFAFCFAVTVGTLWEMFEFAMDQLFGMNMQKPMFDDPSGLTDTMWDLILDVAGAFTVVTAGYVYMRRGMKSAVQRWIDRFINANPRLFSRS